jgi:hypothetical protein
MSLTRLWDKIKAPKTIETISFDEAGEPIRYPFLRRLFLSLVIILVATLSFGLGRLSSSPDQEGISISFDQSLAALLAPGGEGKPQTASAIQSMQGTAAENNMGGGVMASKSGTKYHFPDCPGAKQIKEANKLYFSTPEEAEASGFTLAGNCKAR